MKLLAPSHRRRRSRINSYSHEVTQNLPTQEKTLSAPFDAFEARLKADAQKALVNFAATAELAKTRAKIDELEVSWCCSRAAAAATAAAVDLLLWWQARVPELEAKAAKLANKTEDTGLFGWWEQNQASKYE